MSMEKCMELKKKTEIVIEKLIVLPVPNNIYFSRKKTFVQNLGPCHHCSWKYLAKKDDELLKEPENSQDGTRLEPFM